MDVFLQFALLGLGTGAVYALAAQGIVLVYRGSGVLNFAHGAVGVAAAYLHWELHENHGTSYALAFVVAVAAAAMLGAVIHLLLMRRLRASTPLVRVVATLGLLILIQGIGINRYHSSVTAVTSTLPVHRWQLTDGITITSDRFYLMIISGVLTLALWAVYRFSIFGIGTSAVTENDRAAASLGWSRDAIAATNWALGSALAGAATILLTPIVGLSVNGMTSLLLVTLAAALVGNFNSFALTLAGGLLIGVVEAELGYYSSRWGASAVGLSSSVPFFIIIALLVVRGRALPLRDFFLQRQPTVGTGRVRHGVVVAAAALAILVIYQLSADWAAAFTTTFVVGLILLSMVVLTGYTGQISLAQVAIAGFGGWIAGRLVDTQDWPLWAAAIAGIAGSALLGALFALPAVRTRGINLAIVTLGLGFTVQFMLFENDKYTGGIFGTSVGEAHLFGWDIYSITHPQRYAAVCLVAFTLCALAVANIRRGRSGRRLLAVRTNERAAAALGISVVSAKLYAFTIAAGIAAVGGILMLFRSNSIAFATDIQNAQSIFFVGLAAIGGIGYLLGPLLGAVLAGGALGAQITSSLFSDGVTEWIQVFAGAFLILLVLQEPDGMAKAQIHQAEWLAGRVRALAPGLRVPSLLRRRDAGVVPLSTAREGKVDPKILEVRDVTVRYGAVTACDQVSLTVRPGEVVGLIGPNGAGKTTLIDAITGFARPAAGSIVLDGHDVTRLSAVRRSRAGLSRSFQSLELFEDMTVLDNLRTASEPRDVLSYARDLVYPMTPPLRPEVLAAISEFRLDDQLDRKVADLAYGERRLLAVARAVATEPSVLLLDECAAGLSDTETRELASLVRRLAEEWGFGILVIEHDVNFVMSICDHVVVLDFGRKISEGTPDVVRNDPAVIAAYLGHPDEDAIPAPRPTGVDAASRPDGERS